MPATQHTPAGPEADRPCDRCGMRFNPLNLDQFWFGEWTEVRDGEEQTYEFICDACKDDLDRGLDTRPKRVVSSS